MNNESLAADLRSRCVVTQSDCWQWTGHTKTRGYGTYHKKPAHRVSYECFVGPIPRGLHIDHLCRNRACINPKHLEPVTMAENIRRGISFSANNARKTHCKNGHKLSDENIYLQGGKRRQCRKCNAAAVKRYKKSRRGAA